MKSLGQHKNIMSLGQLNIFIIIVIIIIIAFVVVVVVNIIKIKRIITVCLILDEGMKSLGQHNIMSLGQLKIFHYYYYYYHYYYYYCCCCCC